MSLSSSDTLSPLNISDGPDLIQAYLPDVSRETMERMERYVALVKQWQKIKNLIAPASLPHIWKRHVLDSAQLVKLDQKSETIVDLGSGAGFPGLIMAVLKANNPKVNVSLVEANGRKTAFLKTVARDMNLPVTVYPERIESLTKKWNKPVDLVTARALAPLHKLVPLIKPFLDQGAKALLHKGADFEAEINETQKKWNMDLIIHTSITHKDARILEIQRIKG